MTSCSLLLVPEDVYHSLYFSVVFWYFPFIFYSHNYLYETEGTHYNLNLKFFLTHNSCMHGQSLQLCTTLWDPMDRSLPGSSVHGILQAKILEWVAMPSSRGFSSLRVWMWVSCSFCIAGGFFTSEPQGSPTVRKKVIEESQKESHRRKFYRKCLMFFLWIWGFFPCLFNSFRCFFVTSLPQLDYDFFPLF